MFGFLKDRYCTNSSYWLSLLHGANVVEWHRALDLRLSDWCCRLQCTNGVSSNPVEGRTKIWQLKNIILTTVTTFVSDCVLTLPPNLLLSIWTTSDRSVSFHHPELHFYLDFRLTLKVTFVGQKYKILFIKMVAVQFIWCLYVHY